MIGAALIALCPVVSGGVLPVAVAVGAAAHCVGDAMTREGIPVLWPFRDDRFRIASLTTGGLVEQLLIGPAMLVGAAVLTWDLVGGRGAGEFYDVVAHALSGVG